MISVYTENILFEWDFIKALSNSAKHGVSFESAIEVFVDPFALIVDDEKHSEHESRNWIIGSTEAGVVVVVYTLRLSEGVCRIISARKAKRRERVQYEKLKELPF